MTAVVAVVLVLALAACGARVDTVLTIADDGSGSRVMTLTLSASDRDKYVAGGNEALDASIRRHIRAELTYASLNDDGSSIVATFALEFASVDEYREKVAAILYSSGDESIPEIEIRNEDSLFSQGVVVDENFTSSKLLSWLAPGLVADGVVAADNQRNVTESGSTILRVRGEELEQPDPISYSKVRDLGMQSVSMETTLTGLDSVERVINYVMPTPAYQTDKAAFDAFMAEATPDGGQLDEGPAVAGSTTWTMTITTALKDLGDATSQALGGAAASFDVVSDFDPNGPMIVTRVASLSECGSMCSPDAAAITDALSVPGEWKAARQGQPAAAAAGDSEISYELGAVYDVSFGQPIALDQVSINTRVTADGDVTQEVILDVAADIEAQVGADLESFFGSLSGLSLGVDRSGERATYTVEAGPASGERLTTILSSAGFPRLWAAASPTEGDSFFRYDVLVQVGNGFWDADAVSSWGRPDVSHTIHADGMQLTDGVTSGDQLEVFGSYAQFYGSGWKTAGLIVLAGIAVLVVAAAVATFLLRRRIVSLIKRVSEKARVGMAVARERRESSAHASVRLAGVGPGVPGSVTLAPISVAPSAMVGDGVVGAWSEADLR